FVSLQRNGAARHRPSGRHAGGKAIRIVIDLEGLVVARHHDDALMRLTQYRRLLSQVIKVGVRIVHEPVAAEEIVLFKLLLLIVHSDSFSHLDRERMQHSRRIRCVHPAWPSGLADPATSKDSTLISMTC